MLTIRLTKLRNSEIAREQSGFTLIEAVIGIALLSIVGVAVLVGISTSFKASATTDKISTGLALAQSQLEYIQTQPYAIADGDGNALYPRIADSSIPAGYSISSLKYDGSPHPSADDKKITAVTIGELAPADKGIQQITLKVYQANNPNPVTLVAYKVNPTKVPP